MVKIKMKLVDGEKAVDCSLVDENRLAALSAERLRILSLLAKEPSYPAEIARQLGMQVQTVYYHVRELQRAGLLRFLDYEEKGGAMAKKFGVLANCLAVVLKEDWKPFALPVKKELPRVFFPFIQNGFFDGLFVLGSPDPHGKYRSRASEFCACELSMLLGRYATFSFPLYVLDTEIRQRHREKNLVLIGGPKVNSLVAEINSHLPIKFDENTFGVYSSLSKKRFSETVGLVEIIDNPFAKNRKILFAGGMNYQSTRAAVLAIVKYLKEIEKGNSYKKEVIARVVEGFDEDGDGIIDSVEFLE